jgi:iron complex outermembrane recepter protein
MKRYPRLLLFRLAIAAALAPSAALLRAQTPPSPSPAANDSDAASEDIVVLSPFTVSSETVGRYATAEATSGARVAVALMDSTQHVSVVTRELMDDVGAGRLLDAAKYIAGVSEATLPNAQDRTNIRGFQIDGVTLDGFSYFSFAQLDPVLVDRMEVVKGPNAILAPQGIPGGTANVVTRKPSFTDGGYVSAQIGRYSSNRLEFDVNRVLETDKLAVRVVGAVQKTDDYPGGNNDHRSNLIMPMATYRFGPATELTVQLEAYDWRALNYLGIPIDPFVGTNDSAELISGVSRKLVPFDRDTERYQKALHARAFFTTNFTDQFSMRVAGHWLTSAARSAQSNLSGSNPQVIDPATGAYSASPTAVVTRTYNRSYGYGDQWRANYDLQNDFAYRFETAGVKSHTVFGYWLSRAVTRDKGYNFTKPPFVIDTYTAAPGTFTAISGNARNTSTTRQVYLSENLSFFDGRLILDGGVAHASYKIHIDDLLRGLEATSDPSATMPSYGIVVKPIPAVSLFYGFSKQSTAISPSTTSTIPFTRQTSKQNEYGVRVQLLENKVYATVSHFDIKQDNFSVPNPANLTVPPPNPPHPPLFMDREADGWEFEVSAALTTNVSLIANYTDYKNRNPFGQVFRNNAEKSGALWASYAFREGRLKGLTLGAGVEYLDRRPGDAPSGTPTSASTPDNVIMPQPTFWLPSRALVNASISYALQEHWKVQLNIDNLLDEDYLAASINRFMVYPGPPMNARLTFTYKF